MEPNYIVHIRINFVHYLFTSIVHIHIYLKKIVQFQATISYRQAGHALKITAIRPFWLSGILLGHVKLANPNSSTDAVSLLNNPGWTKTFSGWYNRTKIH